MTKENFQKFWALHYPDTVPISYFFKHDISERWFRIHSLPESKRYADNDTEWEILLSRQNEIITELLLQNTPVFLVTGDYDQKNTNGRHITDEYEVFASYEFTQLDNIDLYRIDAEQYLDDSIYRPAYALTNWKPNYHNQLLQEIANDNIRAFFVSFDKKVIIAPYDGGVDFVLKDSYTKDYYKNKYKNWLSAREDGL